MNTYWNMAMGSFYTECPDCWSDFDAIEYGEVEAPGRIECRCPNCSTEFLAESEEEF